MANRTRPADPVQQHGQSESEPFLGHQSRRAGQEEDAWLLGGAAGILVPLPPAAAAALQEQLHSARRTTALLVNLVGCMERMDEQIMPAVSSFLGCSFNATPSQLGGITFCRAFVQALASPLGGLAGHFYDRVAVMTLGAVIWGVFAAMFAFSTTTMQGSFFWAFNGIGLALMIPNGQSMIADYYSASERGAAFGMLHLTGSLGGMLGSLVATNVGGRLVLGMEGWRAVFLLVGLVSLCIGAANMCLSHDPRCCPSQLHLQRLPRGHADSSSNVTHVVIEGMPHMLGIPPKAAMQEQQEQQQQQKKQQHQQQQQQQQQQQRQHSSHGVLAPMPRSLVAAPAQLLRSPAAAAAAEPELARLLESEAWGGSTASSLAGEVADEKLGDTPKGQDLTFGQCCQMFKEVVCVPTFAIIILQGVVGSVPWMAMIWLTLYWQLLGFSNGAASVLSMILLAGAALGGLLGGFIGDAVAVRWPNHGRIVACQFSVAIGVPLSILLLKGLPTGGGEPTPQLMALYGVVVLLHSLLTQWPAPCANNPIFSEIVSEDRRNLVYAFDRSFEGAISAMAAPLVGLAAEQWFGFHGTASTRDCAADGAKQPTPQADLAKATALGDALLLFTTVPWTICALLYSFLHCTYPADRRAVLRPVMLAGAEEAVGPHAPPEEGEGSGSLGAGASGSLPRYRSRRSGAGQLPPC